MKNPCITNYMLILLFPWRCPYFLGQSNNATQPLVKWLIPQVLSGPRCCGSSRFMNKSLFIAHTPLFFLRADEFEHVYLLQKGHTSPCFCPCHFLFLCNWFTSACHLLNTGQKIMGNSHMATYNNMGKGMQKECRFKKENILRIWS